MHEFGTSNNVQFIPPEFVKSKMRELGLDSQYQEQPLLTMQKVVRELQVDGYVLGDIETFKKTYYQRSTKGIRMDFKLYNKENAMVASSIHEEFSVFSGKEKGFEKAMKKVLADFYDYFGLLGKSLS